MPVQPRLLVFLAHKNVLLLDHAIYIVAQRYGELFATKNNL